MTRTEELMENKIKFEYGLRILDLFKNRNNNKRLQDDGVFSLELEEIIKEIINERKILSIGLSEIADKISRAKSYAEESYGYAEEALEDVEDLM